MLSSLDTHSKHNIIRGNLTVNIPRPPSFKRKIWDYKSAKTNLIREDVLNVNWKDLSHNLNVSEKSIVFTDTFLNIILKHISNKVLTFNQKDAPWITPVVKTAIRRNSRVYKKWVKRGRSAFELGKVKEVQNITNKLIKSAKNSYYTKLGGKLCDPKIRQSGLLSRNLQI